MTRLSENRPSTGGRRNRRRLVALATLLAAAVSGSASARADDRHRSELRRPVTIDMPVDVPVTGAALAVWLGSELFKGDLAPSACRWCSADALDTGVRNRLRWAGGAAAAITASNVAAYAVAPAVGVGLVALAAAHDDRIGELWIDALLMTQAVALAGDVTQLVKFTAGRQRPFAHAGLPEPGHQSGSRRQQPVLLLGPYQLHLLAGGGGRRDRHAAPLSLGPRGLDRGWSGGGDHRVPANCRQSALLH